MSSPTVGTSRENRADSAPNAVVRFSEHILAAADAGRPSADLKPLTFAMASCAYPPQVFDRDLAQRSMRALLERLESDPKPQFLLLLGDQVYVDATANVADPRSAWVRYEEAAQRWMELPAVREVFGRLPVYMMLDDHEIDDQYEPGMWNRQPDRSRYFATAMRSFHRWQRALGPDASCNDPEQADNYNPYFTFFPGGYPFFVLNTRTRRDRRSYRTQDGMRASVDASIIDAGQMTALECFLRAAQSAAPAAPKFIASPSVVFPDVGRLSQRSRLRCDGWSGFEAGARRLIGFIEGQGIENVVFLSGDYHASVAASAVTTDRSRRLRSIVSSGLYAPYPFANAQVRDFVGGDWPLCAASPLAQVTVHQSTDRDGFAVVEVAAPNSGCAGPTLTVTFHAGDGTPATRVDWAR